MRPRYEGSTTCKRDRQKGNITDGHYYTVYNIEVDIGKRKRDEATIVSFHSIRPAFK